MLNKQKVNQSVRPSVTQSLSSILGWLILKLINEQKPRQQHQGSSREYTYSSSLSVCGGAVVVAVAGGATVAAAVIHNPSF